MIVLEPVAVSMLIFTPEPERIIHAITESDRNPARNNDCDFVEGVSLNDETIKRTTPVYATMPYTMNSINEISNKLIRKYQV